MRRSPLLVVIVFLVAALLCGGLAFAYLQMHGTTEESLGLTLRLSAWAGLLIYLMIFVSRPLLQLGGGKIAKALVDNRRLIGVTFAAVMIVHLVLLLMLNGFVPNLPGGGAYLFILLMLLTSFDRAVVALGPRRWKILHKIGLYWIGAIFVATIVGALVAQPDSNLHIGFATLFLAAIAVRVTAFIKVRQRSLSPGNRRSQP